MKYSTLERKYLMSLIRCAIKEEPFTPAPKGLDMNALLELAKSQQVSSLIFYALADNGALDSEQLNHWNNVRMSELQKTIAVNSERDEISQELEAAGVNYMYLKGIVIRNYYPKSQMRQMSDNDILYDGSKRDELVKIMKNRGFYLNAAAGISDDFYKPPFCSFEFHRTLFNPEEDFCPEFNAWERAKLKEGTKHCYQLSPEDNFIYTLSHLYKHYHCVDGCGVRFLCDIYLLKHSDDKLDFDYINSVIEYFGITDFANTAIGLSESVFGDGKSNYDQQDLLDFMLSGGVYGKNKTTIADELKKYNNSKILYLLHRIFPPVKIMKGNYRVLEKHIYLLPIIYIVRLFDKLKHNNKRLKKELKELFSSNKNN